MFFTPEIRSGIVYFSYQEAEPYRSPRLSVYSAGTGFGRDTKGFYSGHFCYRPIHVRLHGFFYAVFLKTYHGNYLYIKKKKVINKSLLYRTERSGQYYL